MYLSARRRYQPSSICACLSSYKPAFTVALDLSSDLNGQLIFTGRIFLRLDAVGIHDGTEISLDMAQEAIRRGKFRRSEGISDVTQSISEHISRHNKQSDLYQAVGALIFKLEAFKGVVDTLSEVSAQVDRASF